MHVYFVNYHRFQDSSGIHIHFLANALENKGVGCSVVVPNKPESVHSFGPVSYQAITHAAFRRRAIFTPWRMRHSIIHAWTPREVVRRTTSMVAGLSRLPYFVHMEDNEEHVFRERCGLEVSERATLSPSERRKLPKDVINPFKFRDFMAGARGITCIIEGLKRFAPPAVPAMTFWPSCEPEFFDLPQTPDLTLRRELGIQDSATVITYTGNVHPANRDDVQTLYDAIGQLAARSRDIRLIRCGRTDVPLDLPKAQDGTDLVIDLGSLPPVELIRYINAADILVQPGGPGPFNDNRFPSKLPMFLASGRPVILPLSNIGHHMRDGHNCLIMQHGSAEELTMLIDRLLKDAVLRHTLGDAGREFARTHLSWDASADTVLGFYHRCLNTTP